MEHQKERGVCGMKYVDPEEMVHPLRLELEDDSRFAEILGRLDSDDLDDVTTEEIHATEDYLYDLLAAKLQTHEGVTTLQ
jgi:hypothetical protein